MQLYKDGLLELNYEVAADILIVKWPDYAHYTVPELRYSFSRLIDTIRHYDIKRLLLDVRWSKIIDISDDEYVDLIVDFTRELLQTRLEKIARLHNPDPDREQKMDMALTQVYNKLNITLAFENMHSEQAALQWLRTS